MLPSPCVKNCCLDTDNICMGCYRHVDEICRWSMAGDAEQQHILNNAAKRKLQHQQRRSK